MIFINNSCNGVSSSLDMFIFIFILNGSHPRGLRSIVYVISLLGFVMLGHNPFIPCNLYWACNHISPT